ncbi:MAG TPA: hypothetical protein VK599_11285 [Streptosporangiaceae bacterium]|jgi:hypothetical protein|nr:hypothetical protein [Streptosporangiaceae bacterium]
MPDQVPDRARPGPYVPIGRAAPTRLTAPGMAGPSRRWLLILVGAIIAALLAGASVALTATSSGSGPATPVPAATGTAAPGAGPGSGLSDP